MKNKNSVSKEDVQFIVGDMKETMKQIVTWCYGNNTEYPKHCERSLELLKGNKEYGKYFKNLKVGDRIEIEHQGYMFFSIEEGDVEPKPTDIFLLNRFTRDYHYWGNRMMVNGSLINLFYNVLECLGLGLDEQDKLLEPILKLSNFGDNPDHTEVSPNLKIKTGV